MKKTFFVLSVLFILGYVPVFYGQTNGRIATIEDKNGLTTEVKQLSSYNNTIWVVTETLKLIIPLDNLILIKSIDDTPNREIKYFWAGKDG